VESSFDSFVADLMSAYKELEAEELDKSKELHKRRNDAYERKLLKEAQVDEDTK